MPLSQAEEVSRDGLARINERLEQLREAQLTMAKLIYNGSILLMTANLVTIGFLLSSKEFAGLVETGVALKFYVASLLLASFAIVAAFYAILVYTIGKKRVLLHEIEGADSAGELMLTDRRVGVADWCLHFFLAGLSLAAFTAPFGIILVRGL